MLREYKQITIDDLFQLAFPIGTFTFDPSMLWQKFDGPEIIYWAWTSPEDRQEHYDFGDDKHTEDFILGFSRAEIEERIATFDKESSQQLDEFAQTVTAIADSWAIASTLLFLPSDAIYHYVVRIHRPTNYIFVFKHQGTAEYFSSVGETIMRTLEYAPNDLGE